jgi:hypothetical protein
LGFMNGVGLSWVLLSCVIRTGLRNLENRIFWLTYADALLCKGFRVYFDTSFFNMALIFDVEMTSADLMCETFSYYGLLSEVFQSLFPARGRKRVVQQAHHRKFRLVSEPIPRKGTETLSQVL